MKKLTHQRGVAVITALLLTTLAVTIVASLFWQQQVQVRSMENQRLHLQTKWILRGALDWTRLILGQAGIERGNVTTPDGIWATPLAETRLDDYVERERVEGEQFDATLAGQVSDAQARYNLAGLAVNQAIKPAQVLAFGRLLANVQLDPGLAQAAAQAMASTQQAPAAGLTPAAGQTAAASVASGETLEFVQVEDLLSVPGFTPQALARLREFIIVLPEPTPLNVNTASAEVLAAVVENFSVSEAAALIYSRKQAYFKDAGDFTNRLNGKKLIGDMAIDVKSSYFLVASRVRLDRAALDAEALIKRSNNGTTLVSIREN
jgi:general secretion pathway protein K